MIDLGPETRSDPPLECDLVMKGGITSGVIYPRAVCELAKVYRLRAVGGTSAGAIAAAAAAAAEHGRRSGGFAELERLPEWLTAGSPAGGSNLFRLFQPTASTRPLYRTFTAGLGRTGAARVLAVAWAALRSFPLATVTGAVPGAVVVAAGLTGAGAARVAAIAAGLLLLVAGVAVAVGVALGRRAGDALPDSGYGLCTGMPGPRSDAPALTPWLHSVIQRAAGLEGAPPLTFGRLWAGRDGGGDADRRAVDLQVMTTNLTQARPQQMPWRERGWFFDPAQMRRLFPDDVVRWMEGHPPDPDGGPVERWDWEVLCRQALPLRPLPPPEHLPVLVATRMSLSFPVLLSAVTLWGVDWSRTRDQEARAERDAWRREHPDGTPEQAAAAVRAPRFVPSLFTDGGVCSNFPVHFFDRPLPDRPTFAMNLRPFHPDHPQSEDEAENSYLPDNNVGSVLWRWRTVGGPGLGGIAGFLHAMVDTARGWVDEAQLGMPGYRDRIVHVHHSAREGGMNLDMPAPVVEALTERGQLAAVKLVRRFAGHTPGAAPAEGWENHRWVRYRTSMAGLQEWLHDYGVVHREPPRPHQHSYGETTGVGATVEPTSYGWQSQAQRDAARRETDTLAHLAARWGAAPVDFLTKAPRPRPNLRLTRWG